jgi:hypothetical protein
VEILRGAAAVGRSRISELHTACTSASSPSDLAVVKWVNADQGEARPMPTKVETAPIDQSGPRPSTYPADGRETTGRLTLISSPRSALAEIVLVHGQLEVVAARLTLLAAGPDLGANYADIVDAAQQTQRALLSVRQARIHIEVAATNRPVSERPTNTEPSHWFG